MLKFSMERTRQTPSSKAKILEEAEQDDSTITMVMSDSSHSFTTSSSSAPASSLHFRDSLGIQADENQQSSSVDKPKKSVSFGDITIRDHPMIIGDSVPSCGLPITIDWEAQSEVVLKVEDYEECRPERRHSRDMHMPPHVRSLLAISSGCTMREVRRVASECELIRKERTRKLPSGEKWSRIIRKMVRTTLLFKKNVPGARSA
jgi:hypothetical protein